MRPSSNATAVSFADIVDEARSVAVDGTEFYKKLSLMTDREVLLADNADSLVTTVKRCRTLASEPRLLNADIDVLRHQLRVITNLCRVSLDMIDPDFNPG